MNQISYLTEEKFEHKRKAKTLLDDLKRKEKKIKFHERRIGKNTIVYCKMSATTTTGKNGFCLCLKAWKKPLKAQHCWSKK